MRRPLITVTVALAIVLAGVFGSGQPPSSGAEQDPIREQPACTIYCGDGTSDTVKFAEEPCWGGPLPAGQAGDRYKKLTPEDKNRACRTLTDPKSNNNPECPVFKTLTALCKEKDKPPEKEKEKPPEKESCRKRETVWFKTSRNPVGNTGVLECRVDITGCGRVVTEKTIVAVAPPLDVNSVCDVFVGKVAVKYPSEVCCDCAYYEQKRCNDLRNATYYFDDILRFQRTIPVTDDHLKKMADLARAIAEPRERPQCDLRRDPAILEDISQSLKVWIDNYRKVSTNESFSEGRPILDKLRIATAAACACCGGLTGGDRIRR